MWYEKRLKRWFTKCIGIATIYWNHGLFCGHSLGKPYGMMESFHYSNCERSELTFCSYAGVSDIDFKKES